MTGGNFQNEDFRSFFIRNASGNGDVTTYGKETEQSKKNTTDTAVPRAAKKDSPKAHTTKPLNLHAIYLL